MRIKNGPAFLLCATLVLFLCLIGSGVHAQEFSNPIAYSTVSEVLGALLNNLVGIIATIAIIFIIIGGIMYMMSAGNENMMKRAKNTWTAAVIGMAIALAAPTFLKEIKTILGGGGGGTNPDNWVSGALTLQQIAMKVLELLLSIVGVIAIISLVMGGIMYMTAYGDEKKIETGKKMVTYSIIGIAISLGAVVIIRQLAKLIGAQA